VLQKIQRKEKKTAKNAPKYVGFVNLKRRRIKIINASCHFIRFLYFIVLPKIIQTVLFFKS